MPNKTDANTPEEVRSAVIAANGLGDPTRDGKVGDPDRDKARDELDALLKKGPAHPQYDARRVWELHYLVNDQPVPNKATPAVIKP